MAVAMTLRFSTELRVLMKLVVGTSVMYNTSLLLCALDRLRPALLFRCHTHSESIIYIDILFIVILRDGSLNIKSASQ